MTGNVSGAPDQAPQDRKPNTTRKMIVPLRRTCVNYRIPFQPWRASYQLCPQCRHYRQLFDATRAFLELGR